MAGFGFYSYQPPVQPSFNPSFQPQPSFNPSFQPQPSYNPQDCVHWMACYNGRVPHGTAPAGRDTDGQALYAGRARHNGDLLPAKIKPNHNGAYVAWGGREHMKTEYEVLISRDVAWKYAHDGNIPSQAMVVGHTASGENLYLGRAYHQGATTPGKVQPSHRCLYIPFNCQEVAIKEYEILVLL